MESTNWQPKWWSEEKHGGAWDRVKEAMRRDWEQTKKDIHAGGVELNQNVKDTVKQATGNEPIPSKYVENPQGGTGVRWDDIEAPVRFGYGARQQYGDKHAKWDDKLETTLKSDWEHAKTATHREWNDVKSHVRSGYDRDHK